jgi:hypothetical protein
LAGFVIGIVPALVLSCFLFTGVAQVIVLPHWSTDIKRPNGAPRGRNDPKEIQAQNKMIVDDAIEQRVAPRFARPIQFVASMKRL